MRSTSEWRVVTQELSGGSTPSQDRAVVVEHDDGILAAVVDGAGGIAGGTAAAERVAMMLGSVRAVTGENEVLSVFRTMDRLVYGDPSAGEAAAAFVWLSPTHRVGGVVGDVEVWGVAASGVRCLSLGTAGARLGSGRAKARAFEVPEVSRILIASDGLLKYAPYVRFADTLRSSEQGQSASKLVDLARLPSGGGLRDDLSLVFLERRSSAGKSVG